MWATCAALLEGMVADETQAVDRLPLLGEAERRAGAGRSGTQTEAEYPQRASACTSCSRSRWSETPDAVAVVYEDAAAELWGAEPRANQLAHYLRELGVRPDARVAICVERGLEMVVGLLAVLKAGGAYVPLDPAYPAERLRYMLEDSAPVVLLTQGQSARALHGIDEALPVIDLEREHDSAGQSSRRANPDRAASA